MLNLLHDFRKKSSSTLWRVLLFLWIVSVTNIFLFPDTFPGKEQSGLTCFRSSTPSQSTLIELLVQLVITFEGSAGDLADTAEDAPDKVEFVSPRYFSMRVVVNGEPLPFIQLPSTLLSTILEKSTPPPRIG